jgi:hypothetical protein
MRQMYHKYFVNDSRTFNLSPLTLQSNTLVLLLPLNGNLFFLSLHPPSSSSFLLPPFLPSSLSQENSPTCGETSKKTNLPSPLVAPENGFVLEKTGCRTERVDLLPRMRGRVELHQVARRGVQRGLVLVVGCHSPMQLNYVK